MVIIRIKLNLPGDATNSVIQSIHAQAINGVIVLPSYCELLNEVPADEEIKVIPSVQRESDCGPGCARYPRCEYNHGRHGVVRINCPLWRPKG